jgi:uncharacterized protein YcbX
MPNARAVDAGSVASLWRYPVKSMMGENLNATFVTQGGEIQAGDPVKVV